MFSKIKDAQIVVKNKQGLKVLDLYEMDGKVYAKNGTYFVSILNTGITANANLTWTKINGIDPKFENCQMVL